VLRYAYFVCRGFFLRWFGARTSRDVLG
jgi:hypothetical protein